MKSRDEQDFSQTANCYGYAAKCAVPNNSSAGTAKPGGVTFGGDLGGYCTALKAGVIADGAGKATYLSDYAVNTITAANIPSASSANKYLIAMLVQKSGFHFVRRQRKHDMPGDPFWKWKQGNGGKVERNAYNLAATTFERITDAKFPDLIRGKLILADSPGYNGWERVFFFEVDQEGFKVTASAG
ncbi:hypothetical protein A9Q99_04985 [Gammaproteobacteria bacterium 45_16_T64]|nr:hypothetical protein A9Q99_04985 [Gammaproteobacteria bacterium 45_16_T64]